MDYLKPEIQLSIKNQNASWESPESITDGSRYVDLMADREEYTGYQGQSVWRYLYNTHCENSFRQCSDNKFLYWVISGMHSSVSSHLSFYYKDERSSYNNLSEYKLKVGWHKERLSNLLFVNRLMVLSFNQLY